MPPLWMVRRPFISSRGVSQPALRVSPPPPPVPVVALPLVAVVELVAPPAPSVLPVDGPAPTDPLGPGPPEDDIPPIEVELNPPPLDALLDAAPVVLVTDDEPDVTLDEPEVALAELAAELVELAAEVVEPDAALEAVIPSVVLSSAGAGSAVSVAHAQSNRLEKESAPTHAAALIPLEIEPAHRVVGAK